MRGLRACDLPRRRRAYYLINAWLRRSRHSGLTKMAALTCLALVRWKSARRSLLAILPLLLHALAVASGAGDSNPGSAAAAAAALAARVLGAEASKSFSFSTTQGPSTCDTNIGPCCTVAAAADGTIQIHGATAVTMSYCLAQYCKRELLMSFTWERSGGFQVPVTLPSPLPVPAGGALALQKRCAPGQGQRCHTHYMNVVTSSYSAWNWGWERWEREIDWMALHGINLVFAFTGQEYIWRETYREFGLNDSQIQSGFNGPAFLAWSRGQGGHQNGGVFSAGGRFQYSLSDEFLIGQWDLQKLIVARQTELGIGSVLPAFMGNVPGPLKTLFPHANISGDGSPGSVWLDALDPLFAMIGKSFLSKVMRDFGTTGYYEADGFFGKSAAPWMTDVNAGDAVLAHESDLPSTHCSPAFVEGLAERAPPPTCEFGPQRKMSYIPGEATDHGKLYSSLAAAKAACQKDVFCGGALSRSCNVNNTVCSAFQTRSGMSPCPNAGVPCPGDIPKVLPEPTVDAAQNAYPITNTQACGHHAPSAQKPSEVDNGRSAHAHALAVYAIMKELDKDAVWVFQGWPWMRAFLGTHQMGWPDTAGRDYMRNFTSAVPPRKLLILDMRSECESVASRTDSLYGTPFVWEVMDDFGGTNGMFGDVSLVRNQIAAASADLSGANLTSLAGTGISMEGIDQNPVFYEAVLDGLWVDADHHMIGGIRKQRQRGVDALATPVDAPGLPSPNTTQYMQDWGAQRCGKRLPRVEQAWKILSTTTYRAGQGVGLGHRYCSNTFPGSGSIPSSGFWRGGYETDEEASAYSAQLLTAWKLLTESADECDTVAARFDVADLGREWLQSVPCPAAWQALAAGWTSRSLLQVQAAAAALDQSLLEMDELLSTADGFTLGSWIAAARNLSNTSEGQRQLEMNARAQVTTWTLCQPGASRECPPGFFSGIMDYAVKQWGGLMREYQAKRLGMFTAQVGADLAANATAINISKFKAAYYAEQMAWLRTEWNSTELPAHGVGDVVAISRRIQQRYEQAAKPHDNTRPLR